MGLDDLIAAAVAKLGPATREAGQGAGLYKDFADADYEYKEDGSTTLMATTTTNYLAWQKLLLMQQAYDVTCWAKAGTGA